MAEGAAVHCERRLCSLLGDVALMCFAAWHQAAVLSSVLAEIEWKTGVHGVVFFFAAVGSVVGRSVTRGWMWWVVERKCRCIRYGLLGGL